MDGEARASARVIAPTWLGRYPTVGASQLTNTINDERRLAGSGDKPALHFSRLAAELQLTKEGFGSHTSRGGLLPPNGGVVTLVQTDCKL